MCSSYSCIFFKCYKNCLNKEVLRSQQEDTVHTHITSCKTVFFFSILHQSQTTRWKDLKQHAMLTLWLFMFHNVIVAAWSQWQSSSRLYTWLSELYFLHQNRPHKRTLIYTVYNKLLYMKRAKFQEKYCFTVSHRIQDDVSVLSVTRNWIISHPYLNYSQGSRGQCKQ